jgi:surface protein
VFKKIKNNFKLKRVAYFFAIVFCILLSSTLFFGCQQIVNLRKISNGYKINRIIFTDDLNKYSTNYEVELNKFDGVSGTNLNMHAYKNGDGYDIVFCGDLSKNDDEIYLNRYENNCFKVFASVYGFGLDDGSMSHSYNNSHLFSGIVSYNKLDGTSNYKFYCNNSNCTEYNKTVIKNSYDSGYKCSVCNETLTFSQNVDFIPNGDVFPVTKNWITDDEIDGNKNLAPLAFDELVVDGYDFSAFTYSLLAQDFDAVKIGNGALNLNDYSYMFSDLPCKKITIKNTKGLDAVKYNSRDEYVVDKINNYLIKDVDQYKKYDNGTSYTIDGFLTAINNDATSDDQKQTKQQFIVNCVTNGYFDCPITFTEYLEVRYNTTIDQLVKKYNESNKKDDGSSYTKAEVIRKYTNSLLYSMGSKDNCEYGIGAPILNDEYFATYYTDNKTKYVNLSHMFENCTNLETVDFGNMFDGVTPTDISYMFANCPKLKNVNLSTIDTQYVTNMSNMFVSSKADSFKNREEEMLCDLNSNIIYSIAAYAGTNAIIKDGGYATMDEFLAVINAMMGEEQTIGNVAILGYVFGAQWPVTYDEFTKYTIQLDYDTVCALAKANNKEFLDQFSLQAKDGGYSKDEVNELLKAYAKQSGLTNLCSDDELIDRYNYNSQNTNRDITRLGTLTLGGENSMFAINSGTNTSNMFGSNNLFANIVMPNKIADDVAIDLPFTYKDNSGAIQTSIDSSFAGQSISLYKTPTTPTPSTGVKIDLLGFVVLPLTTMFLFAVLSATKKRKI